MEDQNRTVLLVDVKPAVWPGHPTTAGLGNHQNTRLLLLLLLLLLLARDAFVRTNRRAIAMMFVRLSVRPSVRPSVRLSVWDGRAL